MNVGDTVYYYNIPVTVLRKASPYLFGYKAKQDYIMVHMESKYVQQMGDYFKTNTFAIIPSKLRKNHE